MRGGALDGHDWVQIQLQKKALSAFHQLQPWWMLINAVRLPYKSLQLPLPSALRHFGRAACVENSGLEEQGVRAK